ncbi:cytochrome P450 [Granulicella mallensis]|uniref:Linalool 8-monooxygenase n=1 Tax=Granulicella mallensis (strain ATCC BAA-1857 / DSM 23137 / MP5ACTX8) TaxID=682795 RepID=G8NYJ4_GRAMM|nr:cytochrome P450 [Granulicella mallensis]AEU39053.1 Linalool 8-monooxygenase [Granulicella mallensis MP5ACTX8]
MKMADFSSPSFYADPYPVYERLRKEGAFVPLMPGIWATGSYATTEMLLRDKRWGKEYLAYVHMRHGEERTKDAAFQTVHRSVLMLNPPEHTYMKGLLMKTFNAERIAEFRSNLQATTEHLVDSFIDKGSVDLVKHFAYPLPITAICILLGLDEEETLFLLTEGAAMVRPFLRVLDIAEISMDQIEAANAATKSLDEFFTRKLRKLRQSPGDDLISTLLTAEENGQRLTDEEIVASIFITFVAGHETTINMVANILISLYRNPDQLELVRQNHSLIPPCINECLRYETSLQITSRHALEDMEFEGISFSEGETIVICLGAVNRDPQRFIDPDRLVITRSDPGSRNLAFGAGAHYCIGAMLATAELEIALRTLFRRIPDMRLTNLDDLRWLHLSTVRGVETLQAAW